MNTCMEAQGACSCTAPHCVRTCADPGLSAVPNMGQQRTQEIPRHEKHLCCSVKRISKVNVSPQLIHFRSAMSVSSLRCINIHNGSLLSMHNKPNLDAQGTFRPNQIYIWNQSISLNFWLQALFYGQKRRVFNDLRDKREFVGDIFFIGLTAWLGDT